MSRANTSPPVDFRSSLATFEIDMIEHNRSQVVAPPSFTRSGSAPISLEKRFGCFDVFPFDLSPTYMRAARFKPTLEAVPEEEQLSSCSSKSSKSEVPK